MAQPQSEDELILHNVVSDISKIGPNKVFEEHKVNILYELVTGLKKLSERKSPLIVQVVNEAFYSKLRNLLLDKDKNIRETIIRIYRYTSVKPQAFTFMVQSHIPLLISRCLERDAKQNFLMERFQALKFISHWVETDPLTVPRVFFQSLVAIATHTAEDQIKKPVIEILRKGSIFCTSTCAWAGGLNVLIESVIDPGCADISESIVLTLLYLINEPRTRSYLRPYVDLGYLLSIFTEIGGSEKDMKKEQQSRLEVQLLLGRRAVVTLMKNWSGLIYLTADPNGLRSLVQALDQPIRPMVKRVIFDIFFDVFNINMSYDEDRTKGSLKIVNSDNLLNTYMIMVIQAFNLCGIYDVLIKIATSTENVLTEKAQQLLKKFMQLSSILLPVEPKFLSLIELASDFKSADPSLRFRASKTLRELGDCYKQTTTITPEFKKNMSDYFLKSVEFTISTPLGVPYTSQLKSIWRPLRAEMDYDLDSSGFIGLLNSTGVAESKNNTCKWDWFKILELFETHMQKPVRMKEALNVKFIKPLLKYYQPGKNKFVEEAWAPENFMHAKVGYYMIKSLLTTKKGRMSLAVSQSDKMITKKSFLSYYAEQLSLEVAYMKSVQDGCKMPEGERYFRKDRLLYTMAREYVSWIGLFTQSKNGIELLRNSDVFNQLKKLADHSGLSDYLCMIIINSFDYRSDDEPRNILQLWMENGSSDLVLYIIEHLRILYRSGLNTFSSWCIDILVTQIYAKDVQIALKAISVLKEVCENDELMHALLTKWPQIDKLQLGGDSFLARFLRTETGVKFFQEFNWIDGAIKRWVDKGNLDYVELIERTIYTELNIKDLTTKEDNLQLHIPVDCPLDVRNDTKVFRRLPFVILINIETSFRETYYTSMLQTYLQADDSLNQVLVGKIIGKKAHIEPLPIENAHIISCCLRLGAKSVDNYGRVVNEEFWTRCDYNDRKSAQKGADDCLYVEKSGVTFYFQVSKGSETLCLKSITYKVDIIPKTLIEKSIPTHLFGELAKTSLGADIIDKSQAMKTLVAQILDPEAPLLQKRASLWAIGHIGSSESGLELITKTDIVSSIIALAESSECLSLRGTSLYALGLISKTLGGKRLLSRYEWQSHSQLGAIVCLPKDVKKFFAIAPIEYKGDLTRNPDACKRMEDVVSLYSLSEDKQKVLKLIGNLSNHVTQKAALPELKKLSQKSPDLFLDVSLFHCTVMMLTYYGFKLQVRRYVFQLFEKLLSLPAFLADYSRVASQKPLPLPPPPPPAKQQ